MISNQEDLKGIIRARISRTITYLQQYLKDLPKYQIQLHHQFEHPISELKILLRELPPRLTLDPYSTTSLPQGGIPEDINYLDLALNEIKTAFLYLKQRENDQVFAEIRDYYLEQKLDKIIQELTEIIKLVSKD